MPVKKKTDQKKIFELYETYMLREENRVFLSKAYGIISGYKWYGEKHSKKE